LHAVLNKLEARSIPAPTGEDSAIRGKIERLPLIPAKTAEEIRRTLPDRVQRVTDLEHRALNIRAVGRASDRVRCAACSAVAPWTWTTTGLIFSRLFSPQRWGRILPQREGWALSGYGANHRSLLQARFTHHSAFSAGAGGQIADDNEKIEGG